MLQEELHSQAPDDDRGAGELSLVRGRLLAPFVALDGSETVRHENALAVERTESGYRVGLAVVNPGALPVFSDIFLSKCGSRAEWEALRKASYVRPLDSRAKLGYSDEQPTPSLVTLIDLSGPDLTVSSCRLVLEPAVQVAQRSFSELPPLMPPHVPDSAVDISLVAAAQLGLALYAQRRQRGDVVFADVKQGLLLQPDGSWELHKPEEILGRIVTQEITCKVLEGVALLAASHIIPLIYQGCTKAEPALSHLLGEKLRDGLIKSRHDIDQHLVGANAQRIRLLHRREYSLSQSLMRDSICLRTCGCRRHFVNSSIA